METAFCATFGSPEKPHISVLCEYDALPEIGHGCGHNLIAEVGVAAGLGIKAAMEAAGTPLGKVGCVKDFLDCFKIEVSMISVMPSFVDSVQLL